MSLITAFELLDDFLTAGKSIPVWRVVGGGSALLVQQLGSRQAKRGVAICRQEWDCRFHLDFEEV